MKLNEEPFKLIRNGSKSVEVRLFDEKRKRIQINDYIIFQHLNDKRQEIITKVISLHIHQSFKDLFEHFDSSKFGLPNHFTIKDWVHRMTKYYKKKDEKRLGVLGIEIESLDSV